MLLIDKKKPRTWRGFFLTVGLSCVRFVRRESGKTFYNLNKIVNVNTNQNWETDEDGAG